MEQATPPIKNVSDASPSSQFNSRVGYKGWVILSAIILVALISYFLWPSKSEPAESEAEVVVSVKVAQAERAPINEQAVSSGTIFPREQATVSAKVNGQIAKMPLLLNKTFHVGDEIAKLEAQDLIAQRNEANAALNEAQLNRRVIDRATIPEANANDEKNIRDARANYENARTIYQRRETLYQRGGLPKKDLDDSHLAMVTAENSLHLAEQAAELHRTATNPNNRDIADVKIKQAQDHVATLDAQLSYASIRAPISGVITEQFQYQGEFATAGAKLFTIADIDEVIVKASFADIVANKIKAGDSATVIPQEMPNTSLKGQIKLISHATDPNNRAVEVWVTLNNSSHQLRANSAAKVIVNTASSANTIVVPSSAVTLTATNNNAGTVMVVDKDLTAHAKEVKVGIHNAQQMEIVSGLNEGDTVIIEGNYALPDGVKVQIAEPEESDKKPDEKSDKESDDKSDEKKSDDKSNDKHSSSEKDKVNGNNKDINKDKASVKGEDHQ